MGSFLSSLGTAAEDMGKKFYKDVKGNPLTKKPGQDTPEDPMLDVSHPQSQMQWQPLGQATAAPAPMSGPLGQPLPSYEKGTDDVEGDQVAKLHDGEMVLNADEAEKYRNEHGAPTDFPGQVMQNPKGIKPQLDTDAPDPDSKLQGAQMHTENAPLGNPIMNRQNAPSTDGQPMMSEASTKPSAGTPMPKIESVYNPDPKETYDRPTSPSSDHPEMGTPAQEQMKRVGGPDTSNLPAISPEHKATPPSPEKQITIDDQ